MSKLYKEQLLHIATIGKTVGIKGDMKFHNKSDFPEQFKAGSTFFSSLKKEITLEDVNLEKGLIRIKGITNPEDAKRFTNVKLFTTREETRKNCHLEDGEHFWFDIEDCEVYEDGQLLGVVYEVERITISNYLNVITDEKLVKDGYSKKFLIPYFKPFVLDIDIDKKVITVSGALDILEAS
jgi:16S rRNA processing protein RimM